MGINITHTMGGYQFENKENLRNAAKDILNRHGASGKAVQNIDNTIFQSENRIYSNSQLSILQASTQISLNKDLKETLKYLKNHSSKKSQKTPVLGELWNLFSEEDNENQDIIELNIDYSAKNIFAAA